MAVSLEVCDGNAIDWCCKSVLPTSSNIYPPHKLLVGLGSEKSVGAVSFLRPRS
jgi:hypothetical protein